MQSAKEKKYDSHFAVPECPGTLGGKLSARVAFRKFLHFSPPREGLGITISTLTYSLRLRHWHLTEMAIRDRRRIGMPIRARKEPRGFNDFLFFFPAATIRRDTRCICISCTHRRSGAASGLRPLSSLLSHYRRQTELFWIIDCAQMRRNETRA